MGLERCLFKSSINTHAFHEHSSISLNITNNKISFKWIKNCCLCQNEKATVHITAKSPKSLWQRTSISELQLKTSNASCASLSNYLNREMNLYVEPDSDLELLQS